MELEVEGQTGAAYGEKTPDVWPSATATGTGRPAPEPSNCGSRSCGTGATSPASWSRCGECPKKALTAVSQEAYVHGVSTRSVDDPVKAMGMSAISKSQVSRLCEKIDDKVKPFLGRPIEGDWLYLWIDATYVKVRQAGRIVSVAAIVAVGANSDGRREILGLDIGPSEAETFWTAFLRKLARLACAASSSSSPAPTKAPRLRSPRCSTPAGSAVACT